MIQLYKPNSKNTGHAFSIKLVGDAFMLTLLKQAVAGTKKGAFSPNRRVFGKEINFKISLEEASSIIYAINNFKEFKTIHDNVKNNTFVSISFAPYPNTGTEYAGFSLSVSQSSKDQNNAFKHNFVIGFSFGQATLLLQALEVGVRKVLANRILVDEARRNDYLQNVSSNNQAEQPDAAPQEPDVLSSGLDFNIGGGESPL